MGKEKKVKALFNQVPLFSQMEKIMYFNKDGLEIALTYNGVVIKHTSKTGRMTAKVHGIKQYNEVLYQVKRRMLEQ